MRLTRAYGVQMNLRTAGVDTIRAKYQVNSSFPINTQSFQEHYKQQGWAFNTRSDSEGEHHSMSLQDGTLRLHGRTGGHFSAELSVPKYQAGGDVSNLALATPQQATETLQHIEGLIGDCFGSCFLEKLSRVDLACDVKAGDLASMANLIAASEAIKLKRVRKRETVKYDKETTFIKGRQQSFRCYNKGAELLAKHKEHAELANDLIQQGVTRLEWQQQYRSGFPVSYIQRPYKHLAQLVKEGFPMGLETLTEKDLIIKIHGLDVSTRLKTGMIAFASTIAHFGIEATQTFYDKRNFYKTKKAFEDNGLSLSQIDTSDAFDFEPLINALELLDTHTLN